MNADYNESEASGSPCTCRNHAGFTQLLAKHSDVEPRFGIEAKPSVA